MHWHSPTTACGIHGDEVADNNSLQLLHSVFQACIASGELGDQPEGNISIPSRLRKP